MRKRIPIVLACTVLLSVSLYAQIPSDEDVLRTISDVAIVQGWAANAAMGNLEIPGFTFVMRQELPPDSQELPSNSFVYEEVAVTDVFAPYGKTAEEMREGEAVSFSHISGTCVVGWRQESTRAVLTPLLTMDYTFRDGPVRHLRLVRIGDEVSVFEADGRDCRHLARSLTMLP